MDESGAIRRSLLVVLPGGDARLSITYKYQREK
jgi:hypothetical protein